MPSIINTPYAAGASNEWPNLIPEAGSNRVHLVYVFVEQNGGVTADDMPGSFSYNGQAYTLLDSIAAETSYLRGLAVFGAKESVIAAAESGSGGVVATAADGSTDMTSAGTYSAISVTLSGVDQAANLGALTGTSGGFDTRVSGQELPHEVTFAANDGDLALAAALTTQNDSVTWATFTEQVDDVVASAWNQSLASLAVTADGNVTAGVSPDGGVSYNTVMIGIALPPVAGDVTAPNLSSPTGTATGQTTADGSVSTDEGNGTLYYLASTNASENVATVKAGSSQAVNATGVQNVSVTGLTAGTNYYLHYVHTDAAGNDSSVASSAQFTTDAAIDQISSIADLTAGTTDAVGTTNGATDLLQASTITLAIDGGSAITCTATSANTFTFDVPVDGIQLGKTVSVVLTVDGNASNAFSDTFDPALGAFVTLAVDYANLHPDSPMYGVANYSGLVAGDQVEYDPQTQDSKAVTVSDNGLVTITGAATDPDHQEVTFALINADDPYSRSNVSTWTIYSPLKPADTVTIDSLTPNKTGAVVNFSYAGTDVDSYEYSIDGGAWSAASSPLTITGQTSETTYTLNIRPINQQSRGDTTSQQYTTTAAVDTTPDQFTCIDVTGAELGSTQQSNIMTVQGVDAGQDVSIAVTGGEYRYSTDGGSTWTSWTSAAGNLRLNYQWQLQGTAHATDYLAATDVTATLDGTVSDTFTITTKADDIAPVITLTGNATVNINEGDTYTEQGATWTDNVDGSGAATVGGDTVDTNTVGTYTVTYDYTDAAGNAAAQVTRTVNVLDASAPTISLLGDAVVTHAQGSAYNDAGATASDAIDGDLTADITVTGLNFDVNTVGSYTIRYNVSDSQGNAAAEVTRTVNVVDATAPIITLSGSTNFTHTLGNPWVDPGYSAVDNNDGDISGDVSVSGSVDVSTEGTYTLTYSVSDSAGNVAAQRTRVVTVAAPVDDTYIDPREVLKVAKSNDLVFLHDGSEIPKTAPKAPRSRVYKGFQVLGLEDDEVVQHYSVLIEGQEVEPGESVNGLTYESAISNGKDKVKILLSGGTSGLSYRLTLQFTTQNVPLDERSQDFEIRPL